jgi:hypothetical protein
MKRITTEETRNMSSIVLEVDATGKVKPVVKLFFEQPTHWPEYAAMARKALAYLRGEGTGRERLRDSMGRFSCRGKSSTGQGREESHDEHEHEESGRQRSGL